VQVVLTLGLGNELEILLGESVGEADVVGRVYFESVVREKQFGVVAIA
jgi:hypothetical protein